MILAITASISLAIWCYLAIGRGGFWRLTERDDSHPPAPEVWPRVAIVVPARDEAEVIAKCLGSLLRQDYPGPCSVVLVDDNSTDGTADIARRVAAECDPDNRLRIVTGRALPTGWTGKLWAVSQGMAAARSAGAVDYFLLSDADIVYAPEMLRWLVAHTLARQALLTSFMVKLRCDSGAERFLVPAFVFFFQMLYPFSWVNRRTSAVAAAAGGCVLVHAATLQEIGGIETIRDALIDDCALAGKVKARGPIWLGLTDRVTSIRSYPNWSDVAQMVSRSAYAQLGYSPLRLTGAVAAMTLTFVVPPLAALAGSPWASFAGLTAWAIMALLFVPMLRMYGIPRWRAVALPAIACSYLMFTLNSAWQSIRGKGGFWKGRFQAARKR
ncbi:MAG: glycosyltransferase [Alphaproteobacteria bacterium]|nr:glycosyltransferase [Alphaproteobacteria bacterium]